MFRQLFCDVGMDIGVCILSHNVTCIPSCGFHSQSENVWPSALIPTLSITLTFPVLTPRGRILLLFVSNKFDAR